MTQIEKIEQKIENLSGKLESLKQKREEMKKLGESPLENAIKKNHKKAGIASDDDSQDPVKRRLKQNQKNRQ